tara:strand:- start:64065 stop:64718 length:654 start_codon:yes stop_codon:yes gene_type:complete
MFGRSPIKPLQEHMEKVQQAVKQLVPFFDAVFAGKWDKAEKLQNDISNLEREADDIKQDVRLHLPKSLFLPVPRTDLLELVSLQDKVANKAKDIAGLILGRKMEFPTALQADFKAYLERNVACSKQARKAIRELDELLETGFRGKEVTLVEEMIQTLDTIENETDTIQRAIRHAMYAIEKELDPIDAMFIYKIVEWIGELADRAQSIGGRLQLILAQ